MIEQKKLIKVGMADLNILAEPGVIRTTGLGSCVGVTLYDPVSRICGMAHVMLPSSSIARESVDLNRAKYADTAIVLLLDRMKAQGASQPHIVAKMAGGSQMFQFAGSGDTLRIGPRNTEACKEALNLADIPLIAEDCGGHHGRTIDLDRDTGVLTIRSVQMGVKEL
ncbi:chemotaxis protein CheD [Paenibacillus sp. TCA20]|uniref:Probable chemoreceptor glutamine deamidase CheD n=1 Tax=Paenibacillus urinalis TaxID=521520 RepID=A0AAX3N492_9BACL|nr:MULTISPECIES: chemotaxis protein CheD [Paenibacillus]WDH84508.1 chemotaxis protein CheD [Paenibacillus urinalis]GAK38485.1 chemotaxis protein CheD [Paenibacillus sp. TCA20]